MTRIIAKLCLAFLFAVTSISIFSMASNAIVGNNAGNVKNLHFVVPSRRILVVGLSGEMGANELEAIQNSVQVWNTLIGRPVFMLPSKSGSAATDVWIGKVFMFDEKGVLAVTQYSYDKTLISYLEALKFDRVMLEKVIIHELGHVLGLDHNSNKDSVMYPSVGKPYLPDNNDILEARARWSND